MSRPAHVANIDAAVLSNARRLKKGPGGWISDPVQKILQLSKRNKYSAISGLTARDIEKAIERLVQNGFLEKAQNAVRVTQKGKEHHSNRVLYVNPE